MLPASFRSSLRLLEADTLIPRRFANLILLALMATACAIVDSVLERRDYPGAPWLFWANRPGDNPSINGLITFFFALITYVLLPLVASSFQTSSHSDANCDDYRL